MEFEGSVVVISGAGRGIGRATALAFAGQGADLVLASLEEAEVAGVAQEVTALGRRALALPADVRQPADVERIVARAMDAFGRVDVLVNNAGVCLRNSILDVTLEEWDLMHDTNLRGTFLFTRAVLPLMVAQKKGNIVNVASVDGTRGRATLAAYAASKAGVIRFTEAVAEEVARHGIRVNAICPASVNTVMWQAEYPDRDGATVMQPSEVADTILFLASERSRAISGACIEILANRLVSGTFL